MVSYAADRVELVLVCCRLSWGQALSAEVAQALNLVATASIDD